VDGQSRVAREHPDWVLNGTLDMSRPEVVNFMKSQLDSFAERWGDFEWRNDSTPTAPRGSDDTPLLGQDQGLREIIRSFLDKHPHCAFQGVTGDDPTMYFERLSRDAKRGIIITKRPPPSGVTIKPKGLLPKEKYFVSFHESDKSEERTGADLMENGIVLEKMLPGELIYLNL